MRISIFNENESVLLVGEGNFSFSLALLRHDLNVKLVATCYEVGASRETTKRNVEYLRNNGVCVLFDVDATKLEECTSLRTEPFDKVIFNFPHVGGKMRIEKNRDLLRAFFLSSERILRDNGQVLVTLCNGQGGTPVDDPGRRWDDSWKIVEMAAHGNLVLTRVEPFLWHHFRDYTVTGYRSLEKQFHTAGSLTHFFVKSEPPTVHNIALDRKLDIPERNFDGTTWREMTTYARGTSDCDAKCVYPCSFTLDLTLSTDADFSTAEFYVALYNYAGAVIDNVDLIDRYASPVDRRIKRTYRITYRSNRVPLYRKRVVELHQNVIADFVEGKFNVAVSR